MQVDYPTHIDQQGHTATTAELDHVRDMIEQVLFTNPGERVNRPEFGSGILKLVFAPNGDVIATVAESAVHASLQQYLADVIQVRNVGVEHEESTLRITVEYILRRNQQPAKAELTREI